VSVDKSAGRLDRDSEVTRGAVNWAVKGLVAKLFVAAILFVSAGRLDWVMGWVYLGVILAFDVATALVLLPRSPELLVERANIQEGTKGWDQVLVRLAAAYLPMAAWVVSGLDDRFGWSPHVPPAPQIAALVAVVLGYALVVWAMAANAFFSATVRIQHDRGHIVATGGPYRYVRHPGYLGAILFTLLMPVSLGSLWALIPAGLALLAYVMRTALEDKTLRSELDGYEEYTERVRHRLLPGVW
jgi:protein-S-isoprenylcysteine O-methyltransferase Ste14